MKLNILIIYGKQKLSAIDIFALNINAHLRNTKYRTEKSSVLKQELLRSIFKMNNKNLVPEAKEAMNKFKMEAASEVCVAGTY